MMKVFISHKNTDSTQALKLEVAFARNGVSSYLGQHRTENCVQKMSLRGKIKT